jgi:nucleotide-binding universal stress UspA family protein
MKRVVVARADGPAGSSAAVEWATREARRRGLPLRVVHGSPPPDEPRDAEIVVVGTGAGDGGGDTEGAYGAYGAYGTGGAYSVYGAVPHRAVLAVVGASTRPVVVVPSGPGRFEHHRDEVTLGVDARDPAAEAVGFAFGAARVRGSRLRAVHAWSLPARAAGLPFPAPEEDRATWEDHEVQLLADALRPWRARYPRVPVVEDVVLLTPVQALLRHCPSSALVVVGRRAGRPAGSVVRALVGEARCPVAVVASPPRP